MEPDIARMYASSPPPLDEDGEEEDEDDFGEFGGYCCGVSSGFSLSDYDISTEFEQSFETDRSPPDLHNMLTQSVVQPGKELALKETEKITKDQEAPNPKSSLFETHITLDSGNEKYETSKVLLNGPLSPDSEGDIFLSSFTRKHGTCEHPGGKLGCKDELQQKSNNSKTDQPGHCVCNGPVTLCTGKVPVQPLVTSTKSTEAVVVPSTKDFTTEKPFRVEQPIDCHQLLEDSTSKTNVSEDLGTRTGDQEGDSKWTDKDQSNKEQLEKKETEEDMLSGHCGPSGASFLEIQIQSGLENLQDVAATSSTPLDKNILLSDRQQNFEECNETPVSPAIKGPLVVSERVELGEDFEEAYLSVVEQVGIEHEYEEDSVIKEVQSVVVGSSVESDEDFGGFRDTTQGFPDVSQTESVSQEGFADFVTALSDCSSHDEFADAETLKDLKEEDDLAAEDVNDDDNYNNVDIKNHELLCSELPPSDSFADFSSAPFGGLAGTTCESWANFGQQEVCEEQQESWAAFEEKKQSSTATAPSTDRLQTDNVLVGMSHRLQHLFEGTFPSDIAPDDSDVLTLQALLQPQDHAENRESVTMWHHLLDIHNAYGLKVQWVGSHSNRILLDCLGIYNVLFTGQKKQPVIVPMFAAGLGMLEPTKEPVKPSSSFYTSSTGQVAFSLGLEDDAQGGAVTQLNLDFFGPVEDCSSDSDTNTPMPGVDPELYELTTAKLESSYTGSNIEDAFTRLMETVDKNSTVTRKPKQSGEISQEAAQMISLLPDLSFMHASVLMFPSTLTPAEGHP